MPQLSNKEHSNYNAISSFMIMIIIIIMGLRCLGKRGRSPKGAYYRDFLSSIGEIFPYREIFLYRNKKGLKWILIGDSYRKIYSIGKYFPIVFFFKRPMEVVGAQWYYRSAPVRRTTVVQQEWY